MKLISILVLVLSSFALAACGGSSSPEDEVTDTVNQILEAKEPEQVETACRDLTTPRFLEEVYGGDVDKCIEQPLSDDSSIDDPGEVSVDSVEIDGEKAAVKIVTVGGDTDGNDGTWTMAEEDGEWKLDRLEDDFLRSTFAVSVNIVDEGVVSYEPMRECMSAQVAKLKSPQLRELMFQVYADEKSKATQSFLTIAKKCPKPMAEFVADELSTQIVEAGGGQPKQVKCVRDALVPLLMLTDLSSMALSDDGSGFAGAALAGLISGALKQCPGAYNPGG